MNLTWLRIPGLVAAFATAALPSATAETVVFNLETATFADIQAAMDAGALTSVELATLYLNRRAAYDQAGPRLNSVVAISPTLFADAAASDQRRATGALLGPLDGLPFVTKDSYNTVGMASTGGISGWVDMIATADCPIVERLRAAGAVLLGHANMDRFANSASNTVSEPYGATLNAYTLGVPAGSSGGPAVAAGGNFAAFGFGGETGGSIRNPSDRAGVVGYKVGVGTVPIGDILALVPDRDVIGPMTRYAEDNAKVMDVATFDDPTDIWYPINISPDGARVRPSDYTTQATTTSLAGKRIGVIGNYVGQPYPSPAPTPIALPDVPANSGNSANTTGVNTVQAEILTNFNRSLAELEALGATIVTVYLPPNVDTAVNTGDGQPTRRLYVTPPNEVSIATRAQAYAHYTYFTGDFDESNDPVTRLTQAGQSQNLRNAVAAQNFTTFVDANGAEHFAAQRLINRRFEAWMDENNLDVLVWPTHHTKSRTGGSVPGRDLVNNLGLPACTIPNGIIPSTGEPTTLAFCGRYREDDYVLALGAAYEKATRYRIPSPLAPPLEGESFVYNTTPPSPLRAKSSDVDAPVLSVAKKVKRVGSGKKTRLVFTGAASDASGVSSLKVYVNGRKVAASLKGKWTASLSLSAARRVAGSNQKSVSVTVMAKDSSGNASAVSKTVALGNTLAL